MGKRLIANLRRQDTICVPRSYLFDFMSDPENWAKLDSTILHTDARKSEGFVADGTLMKITHMNGDSFTVVQRGLRPKVIVREIQAQRLKGKAVYSFERTAEGHTYVDLSFAITEFFGALGTLLAPFAGPYAEKYLGKEGALFSLLKYAVEKEFHLGSISNNGAALR